MQARAPYAGLTSTAVSKVVQAACRRAGLPEVGAHRLRHTAAASLRRAGAPLFEIGQLLRHQHAVTTAIRPRRRGRAGRADTPLAGRRGMTDLHAAAAEYLAIRRALGFKLRGHDRLLASLS